ncbi:rhombosortase [Pantoea sp. 18069]|uniref:rhombosortase n=1 Tax=Pantoea sp. 18069 TaxID=2681415 RepID=UPI001356C89E|nr:rhombosortase [Pantoea sp. 18069]
MSQERVSRARWRGLLALLLAIAALQALPACVRTLLRHEPQALAAGQWWRLLSAHWIHLSGAHAALNACGLVLCCALADATWSTGRLLARMAMLGMGISLLLWALSPQTTDYVGMSGVLYGLMVWMLLPALRARRDGMAALMLLLVLAWLGWQSWAGPDPREEMLIGGYIVTQAHWFGALGGLVGALASGRTRPLA